MIYEPALSICKTLRHHPRVSKVKLVRLGGNPARVEHLSAVVTTDKVRLYSPDRKQSVYLGTIELSFYPYIHDNEVFLYIRYSNLDNAKGMNPFGRLATPHCREGRNPCLGQASNIVHTYLTEQKYVAAYEFLLMLMEQASLDCYGVEILGIAMPGRDAWWRAEYGTKYPD